MVNKIKVKYIKKFENHKNIHNKYNKFNILFILLFIPFSISIQKVNSNKINKLLYDSEIVLTIKGTDIQQILNTEFRQNPSEILVNGGKIDVLNVINPIF